MKLMWMAVSCQRSPPLDEIARLARTGIATLCRRFPDRSALIREVALDALLRTADEARLAAAQEPGPFAALARSRFQAGSPPTFSTASATATSAW
jgi:AcrR family transcriptional regulator